MPVLNSIAQPWTEAQERQLAIIGLEATRAMESLFEPIRQMQEAVEVMVEPIRRMQETLNALPLLSIAKMASEIAESQRKMLAVFDNSSVRSVAKFASIGIFTPNIRNAEIIDGEIQDESNPKETTYMQQTQVIALPQQQALVPVIPARPRYEAKSIMGLKEIAGRSFQYKRKTLKKLSYRNCEGRLLSLFLASKDLFVSDTDIYDSLHIPDGRNFSWVLRNLKRKFRTNGLSAIIERRWNPDGYILIDISYLQ